jgi:hypothetical protein
MVISVAISSRSLVVVAGIVIVLRWVVWYDWIARIIRRGMG